MELTLLCTFLALYFTFMIFKFLLTKTRKNLPPSPSSALPILGHLHLLKQPLHRTLHKLSQKYGPIFALRLGVRHVIVVSSLDIAQECFTKNDIVFANRPRVLADKYIGYNHTTMAGSPYGQHWRSLRRIASQEVFSHSRLNSFTHVHQEEVRLLLQSIYKISGHGFSEIVLKPKLSELTFNVITRMVAGKRYFTENNTVQGNEFRELVSEVLKNSDSSNPEDFLPFLEWIDYRGLKKRLAALGKKLDDFCQGLTEEHRLEPRNTMIGHFLALQESQPELYDDQTIKGLITNMLLAGTDTAAVTIEWAMSLLLNHPDVLNKLKMEIDSQVGSDRLIEEQDLPNLHYLQQVMSENFRMFPSGPLLLPHESSEGCEVRGYTIPHGTILLVNIWTIHRDPKIWTNPTRFMPERFDGADSNKLLSFGMGRRVCPASGFGQRMVGLALGSLVQCFEWERPSSEEIDLTEGKGLTMPKLKPLKVKCKPREIMCKFNLESAAGTYKTSSSC